MESSESSLEPRSLLKRELDRRLRKNPRYSLRSFARDLGVSHSLLSLALSGKRNVSRRLGLKTAALAGLTPEDTRRLFGAEPGRRAPTSALAENFRRITLDTFTVISEWYCYALLSLLEIPGAKWEAGDIARRLSITEAEARKAMGALSRLKLVREIGGRWRQTGQPLKVENTLSTAATKRFHRQLLAKALESMEKDPKETRDLSSMTFAMDPVLVPYAVKRIREFRRELMKELETMGKPAAVYNLTVQIYPVSKP